jgi:hypothetical protein
MAKKNEPNLEGSNYSEEEDDGFEWDDLTSALTELMNDCMRFRGTEGYWHSEVENFGWQKLSGQKDFKAETGTELLRKILPNTECHFKIYKVGNVLRINNFHHDSPVGAEWYTVRPMNKKEVAEFNGE